jgi:hypothetical protein
MRSRKRSSAEANALAKASRISHWQQLARRRRRRLRLSRAWVAVRDYGTQLRHDSRVLAGLFRDVLVATLGTAALFTAFEALATAARHVLHWGTLFTPINPNNYGGFVGATVSAEAALLALFFTTVGVIASTAYARVPGEIRSLFVRERTSLIYVWNVAAALLLGLGLLTMPLVAHRWPHGITVLLFAVLTAFSVLSLVVLGTRLFNFFDLSTLSLPLRRRFLRGAIAASAAGRSVPREAQQQAAHDQASAVLRIYGQLTDLVEKRDVSEGRAAERIALELLDCWQAASALKPTIPTKSKWFSLAPSHPNWLTMNHTQLSMALATATGAQPTMTPDPLWAENLIARYLERLLPALSTRDDWERAVRVVDRATELIFSLTSRLQIDEARLMRRTIISYLHGVMAMSEPGSGGHGPDAGWGMFRLAAADREVLIYTRFWLGLILPFEQADALRLSSAFDEAVATSQGPYKAGAPRKLLELFEAVAQGIEFEQRTEHLRVTPSWWVHHMAGRTLLQILITAIQDFVDQIQGELIDPLVTETTSDAALVTIRILDSLELINKLTFHLRTASHTADVIGQLRHKPTNDEKWPSATLPDDIAPTLAERLYIKLGQAGLLLGHERHDSTRPDLFGQSYRQLFDATFRALLSNRTDIARTLFPTVIAMADRARARLSGDLAAERVRERVIFGSEPLLDMMELSGYALLMSELDAPGIWPDVRALWDEIFSSGTAPALVGQLSAALSAHESLFAITSGGIGRTERKQALARLMTKRGIVSRAGTWGEPPAPEPDSPVVGVFAPWDYGFIEPELADLFMVEYLKQRPDMTELNIPRGAERLQDSLDHYRQRTDQADDAAEEE